MHLLAEVNLALVTIAPDRLAPALFERRAFESTMQMEILCCKTPEFVHKEVWIATGGDLLTLSATGKQDKIEVWK